MLTGWIEGLKRFLRHSVASCELGIAWEATYFMNVIKEEMNGHLLWKHIEVLREYQPRWIWT